MISLKGLSKGLYIIITFTITLYFVERRYESYIPCFVFIFFYLFIFHSISRIKFGEIDITLLSKNEVITAEERKLLKENYKKVINFAYSIISEYKVSEEKYGIIYWAANDAKIYQFPKEIQKTLNFLVDKAVSARTLENRIGNLEKTIDYKDKEDKKNLIKVQKQHEVIINEIIEIKPSDINNIYGKFLKINIDENNLTQD